MDFTQSVNYINSLASLGSIPGLDRIKELLKRFDNPQDKLSIIHVAGTNGKGSICAFLEYGLRECGLRVGRYISPTLFTYLERFQIDGRLMTEDEFAVFMTLLKEKCDEMLADGFDQPTAFEIETVIAFLFALKQKVDVFILECGMGGTDDATNVVKQPLATVFASISLDHMQFLGETVEKIALSKSGIMRDGVPVIVSRSTDDIVYDVLKNEADSRGANPIVFSEKYISELRESRKLNIPLAGAYQWENMATAYATFKELINTDRFKESLSEEELNNKFCQGLEKTRWPGRFEKVSDEPLIIRDGAHNIDAVRRLSDEIKHQYPQGVHLIMGVYKDKEYDEMLKIILPFALSFTTVTAPNPSRALDGKILAETVQRVSKDAGLSLDTKYENTMEDAIKRAVVLANNNEPIIVFGSLSLSQEVERVINL